MERERTASRSAGPAYGASAASQHPAPVEHGSVTAAVVPQRRSLLATIARVIRNAAIAVAIMTAVPFSIVAVRGDRVWGNGNIGANTRARSVVSERSRSLMLATDASITPLQAGLAFTSLLEKRDAPPGFTMIEPATRPPHVWNQLEIAPDMFPGARPNTFIGPNPVGILEAAHKGFSPKETAYLKALATADAWKAFDRIARAPKVDFVGGFIRTPLAPDARAYSYPIPSFKGVRDMAYASVSRAAWHLSNGNKDSAEAALRSTISVGFALIDNGTTLMDELIGNVVVSIGRDGLQRFYAVTGDPRVTSPTVLAPPKGALDNMPAKAREHLSVDQVRAKLLQRLNDTKLPPGERFETIRMLSLSSCTNVRELMFGPRSEVRDAMERARRDLARFPSERAVVDLLSRTPEFSLKELSFDPMMSVFASPSAVAGAVLHNPRLATCSVIASSNFAPDQ